MLISFNQGKAGTDDTDTYVYNQVRADSSSTPVDNTMRGDPLGRVNDDPMALSRAAYIS